MSDEEKSKKTLKSVVKSKIKFDNDRFKSLIGSKIKLDNEEKGIVRYLSVEEEALDLDEIIDYLQDHGYEKLEKSGAMEKLDHLIDVGYVRSKTIGMGKDREEKFYLAKKLGGGGRRRKQLQGRGIIYDTSKLIQRLTGSIFLLIGLGFLTYQSLRITGAVISSSESIVPAFASASALFLIGGVLLIGSFRKRK